MKNPRKGQNANICPKDGSKKKGGKTTQKNPSRLSEAALRGVLMQLPQHLLSPGLLRVKSSAVPRLASSYSKHPKGLGLQLG